jgi:hypothetical protein
MHLYLFMNCLLYNQQTKFDGVRSINKHVFQFHPRKTMVGYKHIVNVQPYARCATLP